MTNNKEEDIGNCLRCGMSVKDYIHKGILCVLKINNGEHLFVEGCTCNKQPHSKGCAFYKPKTQEEWENKIIPEYSHIAVLDEDAVNGYYIEPAVLFITNLLRTEREKAVSEHDAKWHPLVKGTMMNMHGFKEGRQQAYAEVQGIVEKIKMLEHQLPDYKKGYNAALTDLLTKLGEKEDI